MTWRRLTWFGSLFAVVISLRTALGAELSYPISIAVTSSGIIYLADRNMPGVWKIENEKLTPFFEASRNFRTPLNAIRCVAVDRDGKLLAGDSSTRDIYRFDDGGKPVGLTQTAKSDAATGSPPAAPAPDSKANDQKPEEKKSDEKKTDENKTDEKAPASAEDKKSCEPAQEEKLETQPEKSATPGDASKPTLPKPSKFVFGQIGIPMDIAVDKAGDLFVSDLEIHRIVKVAKNGGPAHEFVQIHAPRGICIDDEENLWVISGRKLVKVSPAGEKTTIVEDMIFSYPHTVAVGPDKTAYVCDGYERCIWKVPPGGKPEKLVSGEPLVNPVGMRFVSDKLLVVDPRAKAVFQVTLDGKLTQLVLKP